MPDQIRNDAQIPPVRQARMEVPGESSNLDPARSVRPGVVFLE